MKWCTYDLNGQIVSCGNALASTTEADLAPCGGIPMINIPEDISRATHYVCDGRFVRFPERPDAFHTWDWDAKSWGLDTSQIVASVRAQRAMLLTASDWTQLPDVPLETKTAWASYRQALRDVTEQAGFPLDVVWPVQPSP